jgi:hypothetical protein
MQIEQYKTVKGLTQFRPILEDYSETEGGFCLACGETTDYVEPNARQYECAGCGKHKVYGVQELVLMGIAKVSEDYN